MPQSHYVCSECAYTSKLAGTCQKDTCIRQGTRLSECHCEDGLHDMVMKAQSGEEGDDIAQKNKDAKENDYSTTTIDLDSIDPQ
jgi:hypothetical protein